MITNAIFANFPNGDVRVYLWDKDNKFKFSIFKTNGLEVELQETGNMSF